jgi:hypothetical protein
MKILVLTTEDFSFWSHHLALARTARNEGADVLIMTLSGEYLGAAGNGRFGSARSFQ